MAEIIPFGATRRALVINANGGVFCLSMRPARTNLERNAVTRHETAQEAWRHGRKLMRWFPDVYVALVDETGGAA